MNNGQSTSANVQYPENGQRGPQTRQEWQHIMLAADAAAQAYVRTEVGTEITEGKPFQVEGVGRVLPVIGTMCNHMKTVHGSHGEAPENSENHNSIASLVTFRKIAPGVKVGVTSCFCPPCFGGSWHRDYRLWRCFGERNCPGLCGAVLSPCLPPPIHFTEYDATPRDNNRHQSCIYRLLPEVRSYGSMWATVQNRTDGPDTLVFSFRGSESAHAVDFFNDWLCADFNLCSQTLPHHPFAKNLPGGGWTKHRFHAGLLRQYFQVRNQAMKILVDLMGEDLQKLDAKELTNKYQIQICGHSLGGGLAELFAYELVLTTLSDGGELCKLPREMINLYTFAPAPSMNSAAARFLTGHLPNKWDDTHGLKGAFALQVINDIDVVPSTAQSCSRGGCGGPLCYTCIFCCDGHPVDFRNVGGILWLGKRAGQLHEPDHYYSQCCYNRCRRNRAACGLGEGCCACAKDHLMGNYAYKINYFARLDIAERASTSPSSNAPQQLQMQRWGKECTSRNYSLMYSRDGKLYIPTSD